MHALGIGTGAERTVIDAVAAAAERAGFTTLWAGEGSATHWLDPFVTLSFAAAATNTVELATGVLAIPERNPVVVARQATSLFRLSGGRLTLGIGTPADTPDAPPLQDWIADYVATMRGVWRADTEAATIPVILGGRTEDELRQVAHWADGWYGFLLTDVEEAAVCTSTLRQLCRDAGRDRGDLRLAVSLRSPAPGDLGRLADVGVDQLVLVATPPADPIAAEAWVGELARHWLGVRS